MNVSNLAVLPSADAVKYVITAYLLQARKHQFLNAPSSFLSKLDEIIAEVWITYHFYKIPNVL